IEGKTLLHYAIEMGDLNLVDQLVSKGASINQKNLWTDQNPIEIALENNFLEIAEYLRKAGADLSDIPLYCAKTEDARAWLSEIIKETMPQAYPNNPVTFFTTPKKNQLSNSTPKLHKNLKSVQLS